MIQGNFVSCSLDVSVSPPQSQPSCPTTKSWICKTNETSLREPVDSQADKTECKSVVKSLRDYTNTEIYGDASHKQLDVRGKEAISEHHSRQDKESQQTSTAYISKMIDEAACILKQIEDIIDPHTQGNILGILDKFGNLNMTRDSCVAKLNILLYGHPGVLASIHSLFGISGCQAGITANGLKETMKMISTTGRQKQMICKKSNNSSLTSAKPKPKVSCVDQQTASVKQALYKGREEARRVRIMRGPSPAKHITRTTGQGANANRCNGQRQCTVSEKRQRKST